MVDSNGVLLRWVGRGGFRVKESGYLSNNLNQ